MKQETTVRLKKKKKKPKKPTSVWLHNQRRKCVKIPYVLDLVLQQ